MSVALDDGAGMTELQPNAVHTRQHFELLFHSHAIDGRFELAWSEPAGALKHAGQYLPNEIEAATIEAVLHTNAGCNTYVGGAIRKPDIFPVGRASDDEVMCTTALWADLDDGQAVTRASAKLFDVGLRPSFVVFTGSVPSQRAQLWWLLDQPLYDIPRMRRALEAIAETLPGADPTVVNPSRVMRLAGTISWPNEKKRERGYVPELTFLQEATGELYSIERIERVFRRQGQQKPPGGAETGPAEAPPRDPWHGFSDIDWGKARGRSDADLQGMLEASRIGGQWHTNIRNVAASLIGRGRSEAEIRAMLAPYCRGGATDPDLDPIVSRGFVRFGKDPAGTPGGIGNPQRVEEIKKAAALIRATPYQWVEPRDIARRDWLFDRHMIRKFLSVTVAPGGVGKSSLLLLEAAGMAVGRNLLTGAAVKRLRPWYFNGEDPFEELQRRTQGIAKRYGIGRDELTSALFMDSGRDQQIVIAHEDRNGAMIAVPVVDAVIETIRANRIDVLIVDPFVATHKVSENDNTRIAAVAETWARIADRANCAIELVHHVRKGNGNELTAEDARGAVALIAAARSVRVLNGMTKEEAEKAGVPAPERRKYFRADIGKANLAPPADGAAWHCMEGVGLGNLGQLGEAEDFVGVVTPWRWPDPFEGITVEDLKRVQIAIDRKTPSGELWREDGQAADWVGNAVAAVLRLDPKDPVAKNQIKGALKTWLATGALRKEISEDKNRKARQYITVGEWVT